MGIWLITASNFAVVRLVTRVHMAVFFAITWVGKSPVAALKFTLERFLTCKKKRRKQSKLCCTVHCSCDHIKMWQQYFIHLGLKQQEQKAWSTFLPYFSLQTVESKFRQRPPTVDLGFEWGLTVCYVRDTCGVYIFFIN